MPQYTRRNFVISLGAALAVAPAVIAMAGCGSTGSTGGSTGGSGTASSGAAASASSASEYKLVEPGKLTIGCSPDYPPMEYQDGDKIVGFDYGVMSEICDRLGLECNFLPAQSFDTLVTQVAAGTKMDVSISSITIDDDRAEQVDFSDPYYDSNLAIVVMKDAVTDGGITSRDDIDGKPVGAQSGSTGEAWIKENLKDSAYTPFDTTVECLAALRTGQVTAVVYDEPVARNQIANEYTDCEILDVIATGEQYGIIVNKNNKALTTAINKALADMESDGTMDELKEKWIGGADVVASSKAGDKAASSKADSKAASSKADSASASKD